MIPIHSNPYSKSQRRNWRRCKKRCEQRKQTYYMMMEELVTKKAHAHYYWARRENKYPKSTNFKLQEAFECHYHKQYHRLMVEYYVYPMDVDLLSYYEDGKMIGYTML